MALADDLEAYYKCDEASGTFIDAHNAFDLTETSGTMPTATGKINGARDFELNQTEYAEDGSGTLAKFGDEDFTCSFWFNPESINIAEAPIVSTYSAGARHGFEAFVNDSEVLVFQVGTGSATTVSTTGTVSAGSWFFGMVWHDAANNIIGVRLGTEEVTTSYSGGVVSTSSTAFRLGARDAGAFFDGLIDEVGVWSRMLTSGERDDLYNSGSGRPYSYINPPTGWGQLLSRHRNRLIQAA